MVLVLCSCSMFSLRDAEDPLPVSDGLSDPVKLHSIVAPNATIGFTQQFFEDIFSASFQFSDEAVSSRTYTRDELITRITSVGMTNPALKIVWTQTPDKDDEIIAPPITLYRNYRIFRDSTDTTRADFEGSTIFTLSQPAGMWMIEQWHDKPANPATISFFNPEYAP